MLPIYQTFYCVFFITSFKSKDDTRDDKFGEVCGVKGEEKRLYPLSIHCFKSVHNQIPIAIITTQTITLLLVIYFSSFLYFNQTIILSLPGELEVLAANKSLPNGAKLCAINLLSTTTTKNRDKSKR